MPDVPRKLQFGCGLKPLADHLNLDVDPALDPDICFDLNRPMTLPWTVETRRFGPVTLDRGSIEAIIADNVLEHIRDLYAAMRTAWELLAPGGTLRAIVPHDLSYGAWQDPTHVRAFNERSWIYFCERCPWPDGRFEQVRLDLVPSELGVDLMVQGVRQDVIDRTPRAIAEIDVTLRKVGD